jgi:hypothetical protein
MSSTVLPYHLGTLALIVGIAGVDRWVKLVIQAHLPQEVVIPVIPGLFNLTHIENPGAAFGLFANLPPGMQPASEHCLRQWGMKPTVLNGRNPVDFHPLPLTH